MSRLRRLLLSGRYFFVTCNLLRTRAMLNEDDFEILARVMQARREEHGFPPTAWVFLPDHWHAICAPQYPLTISEVMKSIKNSSTTLINLGRAASGELWRGRFLIPPCDPRRREGRAPLLYEGMQRLNQFPPEATSRKSSCVVLERISQVPRCDRP